MKIPSTSYMEQYVEPDGAVDVPMSSMLPAIRKVFQKLDRMLTAIAYAEAGDLDSVKKILDEDKSLVLK